MATMNSYTVTEQFRDWLDHHTPFHGVVRVGDEWLTTEAWPTQDAMQAAAECAEAYEAGELEEARDALTRAQSIVEGSG